MKKILALLLFPAGLAGASPAAAGPFQGNYVCAPGIDPGQAPLEFKLREGSACRENETLLRIYTQSNGTILLYPAPPPAAEMPTENAEALKGYKEFYGITP